MANKWQREEKRRSARMRTKAKRNDPGSEDVIIADPVEEQIPVEETVEKDMGMEYYQPIPGPTSWDEHDALEVAREKAERAQEVLWTARDLVSNIIWADMTPDEKGKAIKAIGDGIPKKIKEVEASDSMSKEIDDIDVLGINALLAKDAKNVTVLDRVSDWISKKKLTAMAENNLSDGDFALVVEREGKKIRKYPIHDKSHVRNALARAAQMIKEGGEASTDAKSALPKIHAAAKKFGIGVAEKSNGDIMVEKDATGNWRAVMWPSNNFKDYDGEIISEKAHQEYVDWVNDNMDCSPMFVTWHRGGTARKSRIDFAGYENGFLIMSAPLTEKEAAGLLKAQSLTQIGMSHGSIVLERDPENENIITKYRMVEVSDLPLERAANPFTNLETLMKENNMSNKKVNTKDYLAAILGSDEEADKFLERTGIKQKELVAAGVDHKEVKDSASADPATPAPTAQAVDVEDIAKKVFERVAKELDVDGLNEYLTDLQEKSQRVDVLEQLVKDMAQSRDERLAEMISAPAGKTLIWQKARASTSNETVLDKKNKEDEVLKKAQPELGWLSQATGTEPVNV